MGEPLRRAARSSRRAIRGSLRSYLRALRALGTRLRRAATIPLASWRKKNKKKSKKNWNFGGNGVCLCIIFYNFETPNLFVVLWRIPKSQKSRCNFKNNKQWKTYQ
jgi:hypothetical protein